MPQELRNAIEELLAIKKHTTEKKESPHIPEIIDFIESELIRQREISANMPDDHNKCWGALNRIFAEIIDV